MNISKNFKIVFTIDCKNEIDDIYNYISKKLFSDNATKKLMKKLEDIIENLKYMPKSYPIIRKHNDLELEYRKITLGKYIILYTISKTENIIYIVHMYYGRSNYLNKF